MLFGETVRSEERRDCSFGGTERLFVRRYGENVRSAVRRECSFGGTERPFGGTE